MSKRNASLTLPLSGGHVPNSLHHGHLIKPHEVSDIPLTVAHGFQSVTVEKEPADSGADRRENRRSKTRQRVTVKATPTLRYPAAVDNGVLQVTRIFKTPDPYGYFYQKRALGPL